MKKWIILLVITLLFSNPLYVNAAHQHTDSCYTIQGAHTHTGSAASGGGCYGTVNYHVHSGDSINGGGCYGTPIYHVHEGQAGQATTNGCYTVQATTAAQCTITATLGPASTSSHACHTNASTTCPGLRETTVRGWIVTHSSCGIPVNNAQHGWHTCNTCGSIAYAWGSGATNPIGTFHIPSNVHEYNVIVYDLGCGKTEQTVEYYELNCGKTTETIESYSLSCGQQESAGTKVLTCTTPESVDTPAPEPTQAPVEKQEPSYTYKDLSKTMFAINEVNVRTLPFTSGKLLGRLAAGDEVKVTGQCNETSWYRIEYGQNEGYVSSDYLRTEKPVEETTVETETIEKIETLPEETITEETFFEEIEIEEEQDEMLQEEPEQEEIVEIEDEKTPAAQFQVAAAVAGTSTATGGMLWVVFCFIFRKCKVIDTVSEEVLGTAHISKRQKHFVINVPDKVYKACGTQVILEFTGKFVKKNEGVKLVVNLGEYEYQQRISNNVVITLEEN